MAVRRAIEFSMQMPEENCVATHGTDMSGDAGTGPGGSFFLQERRLLRTRSNGSSARFMGAPAGFRLPGTGLDRPAGRLGLPGHLLKQACPGSLQDGF